MSDPATDTAERPGGAHQRPPWYRDLRVLRVVGQVVFLLAVAGAGYYLWTNLTTNLRQSGLPTGFGYLDNPSGFTIIGSDFSPSQSVSDAILRGMLNTVIVSVVGIVLATVVGVIIGIARLSTNWLVRKAAAFYVETLRNIPVLLIIFFAFFALVAQVLPPIQQAWESPGLFVISNRQLALPWLQAGGSGATGLFTILVGASLLAALAVAWWRTRRNEATGQPHRRVLWATATFVALVAIAFVALGSPVDVTGPSRNNRLITGGIQMEAGFVALLLALGLYTASHIAEIVRGSILAVPIGQNEAAGALALSNFQRMRFIVLPQALRIMIPPLANQYLNLTKNTSLAVAIGFPELTTVTRTIISNGNPAAQNIAILMVIYLSFSLFISAIANVVNRRMQVVSR